MMLVKYYSVIGNDATYRISLLLARYALSVNEISGSLKLSQSHVSHKLARLRECGYVSHHRDGKRVFYRFVEPWRSVLLHSDLMWRRLNPEFKSEGLSDMERLRRVVGADLPEREIHPVITGPPPFASAI
jgi:DNA-binding transcriptional ArsR family regulator